jgi:hypothetical protein
VKAVLAAGGSCEKVIEAANKIVEYATKTGKKKTQGDGEPVAAAEPDRGAEIQGDGEPVAAAEPDREAEIQLLLGELPLPKAPITVAQVGGCWLVAQHSCS